MSTAPLKPNPYDLTQGSIAHHLYRLTLPMVWALMANFIVQATDMWFISMLGADELAAMGFAFPIMMLVFSLSIGLSAGVASVVSRFAPIKSAHDMRCLVTDALFLCFILGVFLAAIGLMTIDEVFSLIGADERLVPIICDYMEIFYLNNIITMVAMNGLSAVRALGDSKAQASSMIAAAVVNLVLDPIFIFGLGGFPRLELQGAALATSFARVVTLAIALRVIIFQKHLLVWPSLQWQRLKSSWQPLLHIALPAAGTNMIIPLSGAIITTILATYGEYAVAGMGVAMRIEPLLLICFYAMSSIISPFVGQNVGVHDFDRIYRSVRMSCQFSLALGLVLAAIVFIFSDSVIQAFTQDESTIAVARNYLMIVSLSYGAAGVVMIVNASFNGMAKPLQATLMSVIRVIILYLPFAYILSYYFQEIGIFMAYSLVNMICAVVGYMWFLRTAKRLCMPLRCER